MAWATPMMIGHLDTSIVECFFKVSPKICEEKLRSGDWLMNYDEFTLDIDLPLRLIDPFPMGKSERNDCVLNRLAALGCAPSFGECSATSFFSEQNGADSAC